MELDWPINIQRTKNGNGYREDLPWTKNGLQKANNGLRKDLCKKSQQKAYS